MERLNSPEFYDHMSTSRERISVISPGEQEEAWTKFASMSQRKQQRYFYVMNLFEEIGALYNDGQLSDRGPILMPPGPIEDSGPEGSGPRPGN